VEYLGDHAAAGRGLDAQHFLAFEALGELVGLCHELLRHDGGVVRQGLVTDGERAAARGPR